MPLPRHLQSRFNGTDGSPLPADPNDLNAAAAAAATDDSANEDGHDDEADVPAGDETPDEGDAAAEAADADASDGAAPPASAPKKDPAYARMEGRYKAQIGRLEAQITELKEQARGASTLTDLLMQTREELATARAAAKPTTAPSADAPDPTELSAEEQTLFGDFAPIAQKLVARATEPLQRELEQLRTQAGAVDTRVGQTAEALFVSSVRGRVAEFDAIRNDPEWAAFLERPVPYTAHTMASALAEAHEARDLDRVLSIFDAFAHARDAGGGKPNGHDTAHAGNGGAHDGNGATPPADAGLGQFATPARASANPPRAPRPQFKDSDYRAHLEDMRAGRLSKQDFMQFEHDFDAARRAGRVSTQ
jgi:hypothetical protein